MSSFIENSKTSNTIGTKLPYWVLNQLRTRSRQNSKSERDSNNLKYLTNKTCWVRLVSSIDVDKSDMIKLNKAYGLALQTEDASSLAKEFVLFGGVSKYLKNSTQSGNNAFSYSTRGGFKDSYTTLSSLETKEFGYRPMPGIVSVDIQNQGAMGSVRMATVNFKCWDKYQLDIIDALYFKCGFTMFLEWGHTFFYPSENPIGTQQKLDPNKLQSTELYSIDPFQSNLTKEEICRKIATYNRDSDGNYDAMLGMVTNFTFSLNQEGGYDCTLKLASLGILASSIKINQQGVLQNFLREEITRYTSTLQNLLRLETEIPLPEEDQEPPITIPSILEYINTVGIQKGDFQTEEFLQDVEGGTLVQRDVYPEPGNYLKIRSDQRKKDIVVKYGIANSQVRETLFYKGEQDQTTDFPKLENTGKYAYVPGKTDLYDFIFDDKVKGATKAMGNALYIQRFGLRIPVENTSTYIDKVVLNGDLIRSILQDSYRNNEGLLREENAQKFAQQAETFFASRGLNVISPVQIGPSVQAIANAKKETVDLFWNNFGKNSAEGQNLEDGFYQSYQIPYIGSNGQLYFIAIRISLAENAISAIKKQYPEVFVQNLNNVQIPNAQTINTDIDINAYRRNSISSNIIRKILEIVIFGRGESDSQNYPNDVEFSSDEIVLRVGGFSRKRFVSEEKSNLIGRLLGLGDKQPYPIGQINSTSGDEVFELTVKSEYQFSYEYTVKETQFDQRSGQKTGVVDSKKTDTVSANVEVSITDTALIQEIIPSLRGQDQSAFAEYLTVLEEQNVGEPEPEEQSEPQNTSAEQTDLAIYYLSSLELALRAIQVHSLSKAITTSGRDLSLSVQKIDLWDSGNKEKPTSEFVQALFSNGIYENYIFDLVSGSIQDSDYDKAENTDCEYRFKVHAKYGFATNLMAYNSSLYPNSDNTKSTVFTPVDYKSLLQSYVVPYKIDREIDKNVPVNHPVYISLGFLFMLINHNSTMYDNSCGINVPLVYLDYNPNHNFCLSNSKQLSVDPLTCLIPFNGTQEDFKSLFDGNIIEERGSKYYIKKTSRNEISTPLFDPEAPKESELTDNISPVISGLPNKSGKSGYPGYGYKNMKGKNYDPNKGYLMNILIDIDYLVDSIRYYATQNSEQKVYFKPFIEKILSDINKSLGNINIFRLSYNDQGNVFQIIDDQLIRNDDGFEISVDKNAIDPDRNAELPLFGVSSIAKSLNVATDMSNKLASMMAISANANLPNKSNMSNPGDMIGLVNHGYRDRYIPYRGEITGSKNNLDSEKDAAAKFNKAIKSFYNSAEPTTSEIPFATNFYIQAMNNIRISEPATRAAAMIPVSINFTTDGISGLNMYQTFTVPEKLLPYTYTDRLNLDNKTDYKKVGFAIYNLNQKIQNNVWETEVRAGMVFLKGAEDYTQLITSAREAGSVQKSTIFAENPKKKGEFAVYINGNFTGYQPMINFRKIRVLSTVYPSLERMVNAAEEDKISLSFTSGFRTYDEQLAQRRSNVSDKTKQKDDNFLVTADSSQFSPKTAKPGFSEHQSGIAFDIDLKNKPDNYSWLINNAIKYGFIRTVESEPWHWEFRPELKDRGTYSQVYQLSPSWNPQNLNNYYK